MPSLNAQGDVPAYEIYDFPGHYSHGTPADGEALVRHRLEALEVQGKTFEGRQQLLAMLPGYTFELTQHFDHDRDPVDDRQFLLLEVENQGQNNYLTDQPANTTTVSPASAAKLPFARRSSPHARRLPERSPPSSSALKVRTFLPTRWRVYKCASIGSVSRIQPRRRPG